MYAVQISDRRTFAQQARATGSTVFYTEADGVIPVQTGGAVIMHPARTIDYSFEFDDPGMGNTRWSFREIVLLNERGELADKSLLDRLTEHPQASLRRLRRSGSR